MNLSPCGSNIDHSTQNTNTTESIKAGEECKGAAAPPLQDVDSIKKEETLEPEITKKKKKKKKKKQEKAEIINTPTMQLMQERVQSTENEGAIPKQVKQKVKNPVKDFGDTEFTLVTKKKSKKTKSQSDTVATVFCSPKLNEPSNEDVNPLKGFKKLTLKTKMLSKPAKLASVFYMPKLEDVEVLSRDGYEKLMFEFRKFIVDDKYREQEDSYRRQYEKLLSLKERKHFFSSIINRAIYHNNCAHFYIDLTENEEAKLGIKDLAMFDKFQLAEMASEHINEYCIIQSELLKSKIGIKITLDNVATLSLTNILCKISSCKDYLLKSYNMFDFVKILKICSRYYGVIDIEKSLYIDKVIDGIYGEITSSQDLDVDKLIALSNKNSRSIILESSLLTKLSSRADTEGVSKLRTHICQYFNNLQDKLSQGVMLKSAQTISYACFCESKHSTILSVNEKKELLNLGLSYTSKALAKAFLKHKNHQLQSLDYFASQAIDITEIDESLRKYISALLSTAAHIYSELGCLVKNDDALKKKKRNLFANADLLKSGRVFKR